jgi:hypothetical protein
MRAVLVRLSWGLVGLIVLIGIIVVMLPKAAAGARRHDATLARQRHACRPTFSDDIEYIRVYAPDCYPGPAGS